VISGSRVEDVLRRIRTAETDAEDGSPASPDTDRHDAD